MGVNEQILQIVKTKGPVLPAQVSKEVNDSLLLTSARLSELLSAKQIKISNVKIGGSPLYFMEGQESKLQEYSSHLKDKEQEAYDILKKELVVSDSTQEPAIRVALRGIKDFAVPLEVAYNNEKKIFWKWYLLPMNEVQEKIKLLLTQPISNSVSSDTEQGNTFTAESGLDQKAEKIERETEIDQLTKNETIVKEPIEKKKDLDPAIQDNVVSKKEEAIVDQTEKEKIVDTKSEQTSLIEDSKKSRERLEKSINKKTSVDIIKKINSYFSRKNISVLDETEIKRDSEMNYIIEIDSSIGRIEYFCKFKNKKKINDGDLSSAVVQAQSKGLPLLFLTNGSLTKKTEEQLGKEFKNVVFKTI